MRSVSGIVAGKGAITTLFLDNFNSAVVPQNLADRTSDSLDTYTQESGLHQVAVDGFVDSTSGEVSVDRAIGSNAYITATPTLAAVTSFVGLTIREIDGNNKWLGRYGYGSEILELYSKLAGGFSLRKTLSSVPRTPEDITLSANSSNDITITKGAKSATFNTALLSTGTKVGLRTMEPTAKVTKVEADVL